MVRRALLSVYDKKDIDSLAKTLVKAGFEVISTGGTATLLQKQGIPVTSVEDITKFPECFGGRVKTLHPAIAGGVLFKRDDKEHVKQAEELNISAIDVVVVNLYPFEETMNDKSKTDSEIIEQIDIGGPSLLRSAAKNFKSVTVICDPSDYKKVAEQIEKAGDTTEEFREELAAKVFVKTAQYDACIASYFGMNRGLMMVDGKALRYGENPHQWGEYYETAKGAKCWAQLQGKEMSYLNILDSDAAWRMAMDFTEPTAVFVKHANPSGIASDKKIEDAFQKAYDTDRLSAFGVIIALNRKCTKEIAQKMTDQKIFTEVILAPEYDSEALKIFAAKPNLRVLTVDESVFKPLREKLYRSAFGGILLQNDDTKIVEENELKCVTKKKPTKEEIADLLFAWKVVKHAKSNAIVLAKNATTVGIGSGQTSRVDSTWISIKRAGERVKGAVLASDAFFPFPDSLEEAAKAGVTAFIQPGGSIRDEEVFKRADELGVAMVLTGVRAFRH